MKPSDFLPAAFFCTLLSVYCTPVFANEVVLYEVQQGDTLYDLAQENFNTVSDFRVVQRINRIADPRRLRTKQILTIPRSLLRFTRQQAKIAAFRGDVDVIRGGQDVTVSVGTAIVESDIIRTGANAFVSLRLPNNSVVALPSQSAVRLTRLRQWALTNGLERQFDLITGRARAVVRPNTVPDDQFRFTTPAAVSAVRGTEFRVSYSSETHLATTEVLEGKVSVSNDSQEALAEAGTGVLASFQGLTPPIPLLPPARLVAPGVTQRAELLAFSVEPMLQADRYRFQVSSDAGFLDVILDEFSGPEVALPAIPDGDWFVRVSAINADGMEGLPSTYNFRRLLHRDMNLDASSRRIGDFYEFQFRWSGVEDQTARYRFRLWEDGAEIPIIDELGLSETSFVVTDIPPGRYLWKIMTISLVDGQLEQEWTEPSSLIVSPPD